MPFFSKAAQLMFALLCLSSFGADTDTDSTDPKCLAVFVRLTEEGRMEPELVEALKSSPNVELVGVDEFLKMYSNRTTKRNGYLLGLSNGSADHHHAYYFYSRAMGLEPHPRQVGGFEDYVQRIYTETNEPIVFLIPKDFFNYQDFSYTRNEFVRLITLLKTVPRSGKVILVEGAYDFVPKELTGQFMVNAEPDEKLSDDFKNHIRGRVPSFEGFVPEK